MNTPHRHGWRVLWLERDDGFRILSHLSLLDGGEVSRVCTPLLVWGLCFAVRRETAIKLGGFHPDGYPWGLRRYRGDGETGLALKAEMLGLKAFYQGQTFVRHRVPATRTTPEYFERRSFLQGISELLYANSPRTHGAAGARALLEGSASAPKTEPGATKTLAPSDHRERSSAHISRAFRRSAIPPDRGTQGFEAARMGAQGQLLRLQSAPGLKGLSKGSGNVAR